MCRMRIAESGFTLVEILIVVIILGVLAAIAIPQFTSGSEDAKLSALDGNLAELRRAVELYYHQHGGVYPGAIGEIAGNPVMSAVQARNAFIAQLTLYTDKNGKKSTDKTAVFKYGPYLKRTELPRNPFNGDNTVLCDIATTDITDISSDGSSGWKFYILTGRLIANDGDHDSN